MHNIIDHGAADAIEFDLSGLNGAIERTRTALPPLTIIEHAEVKPAIEKETRRRDSILGGEVRHG